VRSLWRTLDRSVLRNIALVAAADGVVGLSFGAIAVSGGQHPWVPVAMSLAVFAGGAQFATIAIVLAGGGAAAAVAAGLVLNSRMIPYGFALTDVLDVRWPARAAGSHVLTDEAVAFVLTQPDPPRRRAVYLVCGVVLFVVWNVSTLIGALVGRSIGNPDALGLDAASPVVLLALIVPTLRDGGIRRAALLGSAIALAAAPFIPAGLPVLLGLLGLVALRGKRSPA
jgi:predicted branched-subunit amino acid permease